MSDVLSFAETAGIVSTDKMLESAIQEVKEIGGHVRAVLVMSYRDGGSLMTTVKTGGGVTLDQAIGIVELGKVQMIEE